MPSPVDSRIMAAALAFGRRGLGRTAPNPSVGAIVVRNGIIVGRGRTGDGGRPHAEVQAIAQAGEQARGATLYVTLEPCSHHGGTPPCCEAIVAAGITRLVYAMADPNPLVAGRGAGYCREHGLAVTDGVEEICARRDHRGHILRMTARRPMVTVKLAETLDGYVAGGAHDPRLAITGAAANGAVHVLRSLYDAVMVGIGTVFADDPLMTVRLPGSDARPLRIVLDAGLAIPPRSRLVATALEAPVLLVAREGTPVPAPLAGVPGLEIVHVPAAPDGRLDLGAMLKRLGERGVTRIFSEGGPRVADGLIAAGLADDVMLFTSPRPLGRDGVPGLSVAARRTLHECYDLLSDRLVGGDHFHHYARDG